MSAKNAPVSAGRSHRIASQQAPQLENEAVVEATKKAFAPDAANPARRLDPKSAEGEKVKAAFNDPARPKVSVARSGTPGFENSHSLTAMQIDDKLYAQKVDNGFVRQEAYFEVPAPQRAMGGGAPAAAAESPLSDKDLKAMLGNEQLPGSSPLGKEARKISSKWLDDNIQSGDVQAMAGKGAKGASDEQLMALAGDLANARLKDSDEGGPVKMKTSIAPNGPKALADGVKLAGKTCAVDGFVYTDSPDNVKPVQQDVERVVGKLVPTGQVRVVRAEGSWKDSEGLNRPVNLFLFANTKTGEMAAFYSRQGDA